MKRLTLAGRIVLGAGIVAALAAGAFTLINEVQAAPCRCPLIYAPVLCDNGKYSNQCLADCHHGKNCVPIPILPPS
jgi:hypothetical protein